MKKILTILFLFIIFCVSAQDYRINDWKTNVANVQLLGVDTFKFDAMPTDYNDKGAWTREIGNYFIDFVGRAFKIIDSDATTITVVDLAGENTAPQTNQVGRVYQSVLSGDSRFVSIGGVDISVIDELSRWRIVSRDNELFARAIDSVSLDLDTLTLNVDSISLDLDTLTLRVDSIELNIDTVSGLIPEKATTPETTAGVIDNKWITPKTMAEAMILNWQAEYLDSISKHLILINNGIDSIAEHRIGINTALNQTWQDVVDNGTAEISDTIIAPTIKLTAGAANGYYLRSDADGVGTWQSVAASSVYKGAINGSTGVPSKESTALIDGTGTAGWWYATAITGTYDYGNPSGNSITLALGDQIMYDGSMWGKIPGSSGVTNVNAFSGTVLLYPELSGNDLTIVGNTTSIDIGDATDVAANTGKDTTGIYHANRAILNATTASFTTALVSNISANNAKVSNVTTDLSLGTITATTMDVNSSDGTNVTLIEANTDDAGLLGADKWNEIVANSLKSTMIYPDAGIALSTGSTWGTSITDNSANWNIAYSWGDWSTAVGLNTTHRGIVTGNPHVVTATDVGLGNVENAAASGLYEPLFSKNTGFNKNFGTTTGTVLEGRTFGEAANYNLATTAEVTSGVIDDKLVTPKTMAEAITLTYRQEYMDSLLSVNDSIGQHRTEIDALESSINNIDLSGIRDSIQINIDSLVVHRTAINTNAITIQENEDSLVVHRTDINTNTNYISDIQDSLATHLDTLQSHNDRINTNVSDIAANEQAIKDTASQIRADFPTYVETDPIFISSEANNITSTDITNLSNLSGTNTGDQDISTLATKTALGDSTAQVRSEIPDVSGFLTSETDPIFTISQANNITAGDITNLSNLSNTNTGDQDISGIAINEQAIQDTASQIRADIPDVSGVYEPIFSKNTGFNKDFATTPETTAGIEREKLVTPLTMAEAMTLLIPKEVFNETPTGTINGTNDTFTAENTFMLKSTIVTLNGVVQILNVSYVESGNTIVFQSGYEPYTGDYLKINYKY